MVDQHFEEGLFQFGEGTDLEGDRCIVDACLTAMRLAVIALQPDGTILTATALGRVWLRCHFGWDGQPPPSRRLLSWLASLPFGSTRAADVLIADGRRATVKVVRDEDGTTLILLKEEDTALDRRRLSSLGWSPREIDVLLWIARGKADAEIAVILGLSVRTVHHHVGHLLKKLGVESRTAAAAVAYHHAG